MPKGFSEKQREKIAQDLLEAGKALFSQYGLKKTSVADITKAVGISQGAFYKFYPSKEMLFHAVLQAEEAQIKQKLMHEVEFPAGDVKGNLVKLMHWTLQVLEENTLIQQMFSLHEMEQLLENIPDEAEQSHMQSDVQFFRDIVAGWQEEELLIREDPEVLVGLFRSLFILSFNRKAIGESTYKRTMDILVDCIANGLLGR